MGKYGMSIIALVMSILVFFLLYRSIRKDIPADKKRRLIINLIILCSIALIPIIITMFQK